MLLRGLQLCRSAAPSVVWIYLKVAAPAYVTVSCHLGVTREGHFAFFDLASPYLSWPLSQQTVGSEC